MRHPVIAAVTCLAVGVIGYFVAYPYIQENYLTVKEEKPLMTDVETASILSTEVWQRTEQYAYQARDIPSLEADFYKYGYPPFNYLADGAGAVTKEGENSFHEDGMIIYLYMDDNYYLANASIEYPVSSSRFQSTAMGSNIQPFVDFIKVITDKEVSQEDRETLLRAYTTIFNDADHKNRTVEINGASFTVSIDIITRSLVMTIP